MEKLCATTKVVCSQVWVHVLRDVSVTGLDNLFLSESSKAWLSTTILVDLFLYISILGLNRRRGSDFLNEVS